MEIMQDKQIVPIKVVFKVKNRSELPRLGTSLGASKTGCFILRKSNRLKSSRENINNTLINSSENVKRNNSKHCRLSGNFNINIFTSAMNFQRELNNISLNSIENTQTPSSNYNQVISSINLVRKCRTPSSKQQTLINDHRMSTSPSYINSKGYPASCRLSLDNAIRLKTLRNYH